MIRQRFVIDRYDWEVTVFYAVDCYYVTEIIAEMKRIGCSRDKLRIAYENIAACKLDTGVTYSNYRSRQTIMVIGLTSSAKEFMNSLDHERKHLEAHIAKALHINPWGEEICYLSGEIGERMFPVAKKFLCDRCRKKLCGR